MRSETFAKTHGITQEQAKELIRKHGSDRQKLEAEAKKLKGTWTARERPDANDRILFSTMVTSKSVTGSTYVVFAKRP